MGPEYEEMLYVQGGSFCTVLVQARPPFLEVNSGVSLQHTLENTNTAIDGLRASLETNDPAYLDFLVPLLSAFAGALFGYLFTKIHWRLTLRTARLSRYKESISIILDEISESSLRYWMAKESTNVQQRIDKNTIQNSFKPLFRYFLALELSRSNSNGFFSKSRFSEEKGVKEVKRDLNDLFDNATGDEFGSANRPEDPVRAEFIANKCRDLKAKVNCLEL